MKGKISSVIGWYGLLAVLLGYALVVLKVLNYSNVVYLFLNVTGSLGLGIISIKKRSLSLTLFYLAWAAIGIYTFISGGI